MKTIEHTLLGEMEQKARELRDASQRDAIINGALIVVVLGVSLVGAFVVARSMIRSLRRLQDTATKVAQDRLPELVKQLSESDPQDVDTSVESVGVHSRDEIGQVAAAFDDVHREAVRLAAEQALLRGNVNAMFTNLSRRSQGLIQRQLSLISELESREADPDQLSSLFKLDHLATRMRRNGENLLVLAGEEPGRRWTRPVPLVDVLRAAASEVEQYERIELAAVPATEVAGRVVNDLVHLLAELLENATSFSSPQTKVRVTGHALPDGRVLVEIHDTGIGLSPEDLAAINERLASPPTVDVSVSRRMGLFVVGRLSLRHGIRIQLRPSDSGGTTALVMLPVDVAQGGKKVPGKPGGRAAAGPGRPGWPSRPRGRSALARRARRRPARRRPGCSRRPAGGGCPARPGHRWPGPARRAAAPCRRPAAGPAAAAGPAVRVRQRPGRSPRPPRAAATVRSRRRPAPRAPSCPAATEAAAGPAAGRELGHRPVLGPGRAARPRGAGAAHRPVPASRRSTTARVRARPPSSPAPTSTAPRRVPSRTRLGTGQFVRPTCSARRPRRAPGHRAVRAPGLQRVGDQSSEHGPVRASGPGPVHHRPVRPARPGHRLVPAPRGRRPAEPGGYLRLRPPGLQRAASPRAAAGPAAAVPAAGRSRPDFGQGAPRQRRHGPVRRPAPPAASLPPQPQHEALPPAGAGDGRTPLYDTLETNWFQQQQGQQGGQPQQPAPQAPPGPAAAGPAGPERRSAAAGPRAPPGPRERQSRARLRAVAYRMLGSLAEAEDAVQEAWLRLSRSDAATIDNAEGWLTTVVARICLDLLRARKAHGDQPTGEAVVARLPDPVVGPDLEGAASPGNPEQRVLLADSIGLALLIVLETLPPAERLAFVLHDLFALPFEEIAPIVGRSLVATRQLASRARRRVQGASPAGLANDHADVARNREVVRAFLAAARGGDLAGLVAVLDPDVVLHSDGGAAAPERGTASCCEGRTRSRPVP